MAPLIVALVGLPSAGKSSALNALVKRRLAQTGVARTTVRPHLYGKTAIAGMDFTEIELKSDDNIEYSIIDFPGINDAEDRSGKFDEIMLDGIISADLIIWVSDVNTAFNTKYEGDEYEKISAHLKAESLKTGRGYQLAIMLSKCDFDIESPKTKPAVAKVFADEICGEEDTTACDIAEKVRAKYPNVIYFNAHGRIKHSSDISDALRAIVRGAPTDANITFNLAAFETAREPTEQHALFRMIMNTKIIDEYLSFRITINKCAHGNDPNKCGSVLLLCTIHGYCKDFNCTGRQFCTDNSGRCGCNYLQHSCQNRIVNGRNIGMCAHNQNIGTCQYQCYVNDAKYCHHGHLQVNCPTCTTYMQCFKADLPKKCACGNDPRKCTKSLLCKEHGYCSDITCKNRQICTDASTCKCNQKQHNCQNFVRNGRNVGVCKHGKEIGSCRGCYETEWMYCHHGYIQWHCPTCLEYIPKMPDRLDISRLTDYDARSNIVEFIMATYQLKIDNLTKILALPSVTYDAAKWNYLSLLFRNEFDASDEFDEKYNYCDDLIFRTYQLTGSANIYYQYIKLMDARIFIDLPNGRIPFDSRTTACWVPSYNKYNAAISSSKPNIKIVLGGKFYDEVRKIREKLYGKPDDMNVRAVIEAIIARPELYVSLF